MQERSVNSQTPEQLVQTALSKVKREHIVHRGFLQPIQIALKTYATQRETGSLKPGSLPDGLKISLKDDQEKRYLKDIMSVTSNRELQNWEDVKMSGQNNMLSLIKQADGLELAICICMYSEDKKMLKSTLAGVSENIANIVALEGVNPDKIGVFVMMDGIEKVDKSVVDYFQELERSNFIFLGQNNFPAQTNEQMITRYSRMSDADINEEQMKNINNYLFNVEELKEREEMRFEVIWETYFQTKKTLKLVKELAKKNLIYEDLPVKLQPYFLKEAREERKKDYVETDEEVKLVPNDKIIEEYARNITISRPIMQRALKNAEKDCNSYINEREDLAHVSCFRNKASYNFINAAAPAANNEESRMQLHQEHPNEHTIMNLFMCVKYKNAGKLSSHNWFFNGFCKELRPKYAVLLDVGLKPEGEALLKMYKYMKNHPKVGGVCGYMSLKIQKTQESDEVNDKDVDFLTSIVLKLVDIQRTQQVEYHFAHLMDKPFEAAFGFIHVLPGAFSAYNMQAIFNYNSKDDDSLLREYFKSIDEKLKNRKVVETKIGVKNAVLSVALPQAINKCFIELDPESDEAMLYNENVYLAEDRILCMGIHKRGYDMAFLPDAYAEVDPMKNIHSLLGQRKRWINGSFFAFDKVKKELNEHEKKKGFECGLNLQIFYLTFMNSLSYFAPAFFLFTVHIAMEAFRQGVLVPFIQGEGVSDVNSSKVLKAFVYTIDFIYVLLLMTLVFYSWHFKSNDKNFMPYIYGISTIFGLFMVCVFLVLAVDIFKGFIYGDAFLVANPQNAQFVNSIPGGLSLVNAMRWMLVYSILIYILPISIFLFLFRKATILCEIILGSLSFLFYGPTYLIILNIYSLCRIDDISWGTKGLDGTSQKNSNLKGSWKLIKVFHVAKFVIWNVILSVSLLSLGANYKQRFFVTLIMVILIGVSMSVKVTIGSLYLIKYWCGNLCTQDQSPNLTIISRIDRTIDGFEPQIREEIKNYLNDVKDEYVESKRAGGSQSFIYSSRNKSMIQSSKEKKKNESYMKKKTGFKTGNKGKSKGTGLSSIPEEPESGHKTKQLPPVKPPRIEFKTPKNKELDSETGSKDDLIPSETPVKLQTKKVVEESDIGPFKVGDKQKNKEMANKFKSKR